MTEALCAVLGNPVAHSRSPEIHRAFAQECGIALRYERILTTEEHFSATVRDFFAAGGRGLNVTSPFKESAFQLCTSLGEDARAAGAVNTLMLRNGHLHGENTDGAGLLRALEHLGQALAGARILLLGAGGAARALLQPLRRAGVAEIHLINRHLPRAQALAGGNIQAFPWDGIPEQNYSIIINATSAGLHGEDLHLPPRSASCAYELSYGRETAFMQWARQCGIPAVHDGRSMLIEQARLSFAHWFGQRPQGCPAL